MLLNLWLFHVHTLFQNTHNQVFRVTSVLLLRLTLQFLTSQPNKMWWRFCVITFYSEAHKQTIFSSILRVLHSGIWTRVINVCHFKTQLSKIFHTQYLTFLIFIHQMNGDSGHGLSNQIWSVCLLNNHLKRLPVGICTLNQGIHSL